MNLHQNTRIPIDDAYSALCGKAIYAFAYHESGIVTIIQWLGEKGFRGKYYRSKTPMTSGGVLKVWRRAIDSLPDDFHPVLKSSLSAHVTEFERLINKRNALVHAHPITSPDDDRSQILAYQTHMSRPHPDLIWRRETVEGFIQEIDAACMALSRDFEALRQP